MEQARQELEDEVALLRRLLYLNRNQHRSSPWRPKVVLAVRLLTRTLDEAARPRRGVARRLIAKTRQALLAAYQILTLELARAAFMPTCLSFLACLARSGSLLDPIEALLDTAVERPSPAQPATAAPPPADPVEAPPGPRPVGSGPPPAKRSRRDRTHQPLGPAARSSSGPGPTQVDSIDSIFGDL